MDAHVCTVRVRYAETDQMGVVHHANYYIWMELARVEMCESMGFRYRDMETEGILMAVIESQCRYISPARFDDIVRIETEVVESNARIVKFAYRISVDGRLVAEGATRHLFVSREFKPIRLTGKYRALFDNLVRAL